MGFLSVDEMIN